MLYAACVQQRALGLLVENKQIHREFLQHLQNLFVLRLHIDSTASSSVVRVLDINGNPWGSSKNEFSTLAFDMRSPYLLPLRGMPIDRFKRIDITIDAPSPEDPSQLYRAWEQCLSVRRLLLPHYGSSSVPATEPVIKPHEGPESAKLPDIHIRFRDREFAWSRNGVYNHSVPEAYR
jgi:hypothetical protein